MARPRSETRETAKKIWLDSKGKIKLADLAAQLGVPASKIRKWKTVDKWDGQLNGAIHNPKGAIQYSKGALQNTKGSAPIRLESKGTAENGSPGREPPGQCEAISHKTGERCRKKAMPGEHFCRIHLDGWEGQCTAKSKQTGERCRRKSEPGKTKCKNHGGKSTGPPPGSKNALRTGEYEAIWLDTLDSDELDLYGQIETDPLAQIDDTIRLLSLRERRMMLRIQKLKDGLTEKQKRVLMERKTIKEAVPVHDDRTGETKVLTIPRDELVISEVEETEFRIIDDIIRLEDALTRVQERRIKAIETKHKIVAKHGLDIERLQIELARLEIDRKKAEGDGDGEEKEIYVDTTIPGVDDEEGDQDD